ncbi:urease accessory protein UreD [Enterovibrio calviensis]|uniref:urease accessory protein UreD n=1 Tax=Enterovibrio calviensis TaxID=91359 RepID=UPI0005574F4C|nr:urease accessory protein UreD [Enterovibrio calviensis]
MAQTVIDWSIHTANDMPSRCWEAELKLGFVARGDKTVLKHRTHKGPLAVQRSLYPEGGVCHTHLLHPPGGVVGGDSLDVHVDLAEGSQALITTPGATRFYRSDGRVGHLTQTLTVADSARLEWLPLENIAFPNARLRTRTTISLKPHSQFIGWDVWTLGQPATETLFENGEIDGLTSVFVDERLILCERFRVNPEQTRFSAAGLRGYSVCGTLIAYGDADALVEIIKQWWSEQQEQGYTRSDMSNLTGIELGITVIDGLLVVRGLALKTDALFNVMALCWQQIRQHWTGEIPDIPRIWRT